MEPKAGSVLFTVFGEQGSYSDYSIWTVAAYLDKAKAEALAEKLNAWVKAYKKAEDNSDYSFLDHDHPLAISPDPSDWNHQTGDRTFHHPRTDRQYGVDKLFLHEDPEKLVEEYETLTDYAKEKGWIP